MSFQAAPQSAITEQARILYQNSWDLVIQQEDARFAEKGMLAANWRDNQLVMTDLGEQDWIVDDSRFGESDPQEVTGGNRSAFKTQFKFQRKFSLWDDELLAQIGVPTSEVMTSAKYGLNRIRDQIFVAKAVAASYGGAYPHTTSMAFPVGNIIAVDFVPLTITAPAANLYRGLTWGKLLEAKRQLLTAEIPPGEELFIGLSPQQQMDLAIQAFAMPNDPCAMMVMAWIADPSKKLFGMTPIIYNDLPVTAGGIRTCVVFSQRAMVVSPLSMKVFIDTLATKNHATQIAHYARWGAARKWDELVRQILCDETPAS